MSPLPPRPMGGPPPPPGQPGQGQPGQPFPMPGSRPPGDRQRNGGPRRRLLIVAGAVVVVTAAVVAFGVAATGGDGAGKSGATETPAPPAWSREAGRGLTSLPGVRYDGTVTMQGKPVRLRLKVTRSGLATGTLAANGVEADLVAVEGSTYVKGGPVFWRTYTTEAARAGSFANRWTKVPASFPGVAAVRDVLGPEAIARTLAKATRKPATENAGGTPAYRVKTPKADYFVAKAAPHRLLQVRTAGHGDPLLTAVPLADPELAFKQLRPRVAALGGAADPSLRFQPGKPTFINCNENTSGCTLSVRATLTVPEATVPEGARASLLATITAAGRTLGSCTASAGVPTDRRPTLRCTVESRGWRTWMRAAQDDPGEHRYEAHARVLGEAVAAADLTRMLALVDRERAAVAPSGSPSPQGTATTTATPGASPAP
ncbi:hypothetical protein [Spirillospora sp. NPDC029432]|uniref:hypothetical protein n=1 Tax=Spirillospora sp. NPDC029432 TaxID=3154599 RepID=UPI003453B15F